MNAQPSSTDRHLRPSQAWRTLIFKRVCLGIALFTSLLALYNWAWLDDSALAGLDGLLALLSLAMVVQLHRYHRVPMAVQITYFVAISLFITATVYNYHSDTGLISWVITLPLLYYLSFGATIGWRLTMAYTLAACSFSALRHLLELAPSRPTMIVNAFFAYCLAWLIAHFYEKLRYQQDKQLMALALTDPLTGALNRLALKRRFNNEPTQRWLMLLDIDDFKPVNDRFGHDAGDMVLKQLVLLLQAKFPPSRVFRLGGEEFAVLLDDDFAHAIMETAQELCDAVASHTFMHEGRPMSFTVSLGVSKHEAGGRLSPLLKEADLALYQAKANGKNQAVRFAPHMATQKP